MLATALLLGGRGLVPAPPAGAAPVGSTPCVFFGEAHACQSTDPSVTLEVLNQHETSQCDFHESWSWGDGSPGGEVTLRGSIEGSTQLLGSHTYTAPGTYKIEVTGYVVSEEPNPELICEAPPVEYSFTLLPGAGTMPPGIRDSSVAPVLSSLAETHNRWRAGTALARLARSGSHPAPPVGTVFSFGLNETATVRMSFAREAVGRRVGGSCTPATRTNRRRRRCRLTVPAGALSFTAHPGRNTAYFQGRISVSRALPPGSYVLTITATNGAGQRAAARSLRFTLLR